MRRIHGDADKLIVSDVDLQEFDRAMVSAA